MADNDQTDGEQPKQQGTQLRVNVPEDHKLGVYANSVLVHATAHEFTIDFCQLIPGSTGEQRKVEVVSRIKLPPTAIGPAIQALNTTLTTYEDRHGMVRKVG